MADLIDAADYEAAGGDPDSPLADLAISAASEMVREYLHQYVSLVEDDTIVLTGTGTRALVLPEVPVVAVNSVTVGDDLLTADAYRVYDGLLWRVSSFGRTVWTQGVDITVDYDHGYAEIPADIRLVTARLARSWAQDAAAADASIRQESIQDYSYSRAAATEAMTAELAVIARRVVAQVPVP